MDSKPKTEFDSAIIRVDVLKRSQLTAQHKAGEDDGLDLDVSGKCVRTEPQRRELAEHPFSEGRH